MIYLFLDKRASQRENESFLFICRDGLDEGDTDWMKADEGGTIGLQTPWILSVGQASVFTPHAFGL